MRTSRAIPSPNPVPSACAERPIVRCGLIGDADTRVGVGVWMESDSDANILFTGETAKTARPVVRAGTLEKLIQRLTWEAYPGAYTSYLTALVLTRIWVVNRARRSRLHERLPPDVRVLRLVLVLVDGTHALTLHLLLSHDRYRSFTTPVELLHLLKVRYNVPLPTRATASELEQFVKTHQNPIRLR